MQDDINDLKAGQDHLSHKVETGFSDIKAMISTDRQKASALEGGLAFAKWVASAVAGVSGAAATWLIYWVSRHK